MTFFLGALLALALLLAIYEASKVGTFQREADVQDVRARKAEFEVARLTQHAEDLLVPLTWVWDLSPGPYHEGLVDRFRHYLVACYAEVQKTLLKDDVEMVDLMAAARDKPQPRRLPSRPQVPPYLARPEDVAGVLAVQGQRLTDVEAAQIEADWRALPKHGFDVVSAPRVQAAEAHHGAPPTAVEAFRYFVRKVDAGWKETDKDEFEAAAAVVGKGEVNATYAEAWMVDPFHPSSLPPGVHRIIFEGREVEGERIPPVDRDTGRTADLAPLLAVPDHWVPPRMFRPTGDDGFEEITMDEFHALGWMEQKDVFQVGTAATPATPGIPEAVRAIVWPEG